ESPETAGSGLSRGTSDTIYDLEVHIGTTAGTASPVPRPCRPEGGRRSSESVDAMISEPTTPESSSLP
ncbi:MAG: hypothetical protein ACKPKO_19455, partial [Candidatus Fonsibacter sp.]